MFNTPTLAKNAPGSSTVITRGPGLSVPPEAGVLGGTGAVAAPEGPW